METNRITGLLQGLGPVIVTLITPSHIGDDWAMNQEDKVEMGAKLSEKKSWRGRGVVGAESGESQRRIALFFFHTSLHSVAMYVFFIN